jgi:hypothetical protein
MKLEKKEEEQDEYNTTQDITLVRDSLEYYDKYYELYNKKFDEVNYLKIIKSNNDHIQDEIHFFDLNKKLLFKSRFEFIGMHEPQINLWTWAWSLPYLSKKNTTIIRKILNYGTELEPTAHFLKSELITSRFKINHYIQLDIHSAIAAYLAKKPVIYKFKYFEFAEYDDNNLLNVKKYSTLEEKSNSSFLYYYFYLLDFEQFIKN